MGIGENEKRKQSSFQNSIKMNSTQVYTTNKSSKSMTHFYIFISIIELFLYETCDTQDVLSLREVNFDVKRHRKQTHFVLVFQDVIVFFHFLY